ncbi:MAG: hypothetical protein H0T78_04925 [Longispora sp.]|nr:hypothetical protein [Longispora sp. (in: high G+C Gram-positive bacteria)]
MPVVDLPLSDGELSPADSPLDTLLTLAEFLAEMSMGNSLCVPQIQVVPTEASAAVQPK